MASSVFLCVRLFSILFSKFLPSVCVSASVFMCYQDFLVNSLVLGLSCTAVVHGAHIRLRLSPCMSLATRSLSLSGTYLPVQAELSVHMSEFKHSFASCQRVSASSYQALIRPVYRRLPVLFVSHSFSAYRHLHPSYTSWAYSSSTGAEELSTDLLLFFSLLICFSPYTHPCPFIHPCVNSHSPVCP